MSLDWLLYAACLEVDPEVFFPDASASDHMAKKVCFGCSVRAECLTWALEHNQHFGIWGGMSEDERRSLRRREQRKWARPRLKSTDVG